MAKRKSSKENTDPRIIAIANKIKQLRKNAGYTAAETFSYDKGIDRILYWRLEKGTNFTIKSFLRVLDAHNTSLDEFFKDFTQTPNTKK